MHPLLPVFLVDQQGSVADNRKSQGPQGVRTRRAYLIPFVILKASGLPVVRDGLERAGVEGLCVCKDFEVALRRRREQGGREEVAAFKQIYSLPIECGEVICGIVA